MTGYVTPTTWEQCARHVEAGGIVEVQTAWGAWEREYLTPRTYRRRNGAPGGSAWVTRRLVPIESAVRPGRTTREERAMSERMDGWRYCADPVELAAAVAAGVEVLCVAVDGRTWETGCEDSESFRRCMANGCRYRVPPSWSWSYEPPTTVTGDDLPERRVWTCKIGGRVGRLSGCADAPMRRAVADAFTAETGYPVEFCFSGWGDDLDESELAVVEDRAPDPEAIRAALVKRLTAIPPPEPPAQGHGGGPCGPPGHHNEGERTMTEYITPTTWEQCAAHVEAGGVVEIEDAPGVWINDRAAATSYRGRCGTPDDGWAPRRLVPGESAAPAPESSTGIGEGEAVRAYYRPTAERLRAISEVMTAERLRDEAAAPAAGDDLRERIARAAAGGYMRVPIVALDGMYLGPPWLDVADAVLAVLPAPPIDEGAGPSGPPWYLAQDVWMALGGDSNAFSAWAHCEDDRRTWGDAWAQIIAAVGGSRMEGDTNPPPGTILDLPSYQWVRESPTPPPVPPWPGAVLSGLTDEDGVPTWLAQAGQVPGEQVRQWRGDEWLIRGYLSPWNWVEVRAPRAEPEPETERVPWWEAVEDDRDVTAAQGGPTFSAWLRLRDPEGDWWLVVNGCTDLATAYKQKIAPDGTVEVLKDGES